MGNLKIVAYSDEKFNTAVPNGSFEAMLNPDKLEWGRSVQYNEDAALAGSAPATKYNKSLSEKLSFDLVLDCTGVVDDSRLDLAAEIAQLSKVIYDYNGDIHRPNYLIVNWGRGLAFKCVLTSFALSYTFFKPDGTPLRAKAALQFISYIDLATLSRQTKLASPDMSHHVTVREGDSLAQLSQRVYRSPNYYVQLAAANKLDKFRHLASGTALILPPLVNAGVGHA